MNDEIKIDYQAVYGKCRDLRNQIQMELQNANQNYQRAQAELSRLDGSANAVFIESVHAKRQKAAITCDTLTKLLTFIETATRQVEQDERELAGIFSQLMPPARQERSNTNA